MPTRNDRETGARKFPLHPDATDTDRENIDAAENKPPPKSQGLSQEIDETIDKTRQSDGQRMAVPSSDTRESPEPARHHRTEGLENSETDRKPQNRSGKNDLG
jgi:hypothetical protein